MNTKHIALIIEDDDASFEYVAEEIRAFGHSCVRATNFDDAIALLKTATFCYILLDLEILMSAGSKKPRIEAGYGYLKQARAEFPMRDPHDKHFMQIIVMSGVAKTHDDVENYLQEGADAYLVKPFSENKETPIQKISKALRHSRRKDHDHCAEMTRWARGDVATVGEPDAVMLAITGIEDKAERNEVLVGDRAGHVRSSAFIALVHLAASHEDTPQEWIDMHALGLGDSDQYIYRAISDLRADLRSLLPKDFELVGNKRRRYRLAPSVATQVEWAALETHSSVLVKKVAKSRGKSAR